MTPPSVPPEASQRPSELNASQLTEFWVARHQVWLVGVHVPVWWQASPGRASTEAISCRFIPTISSVPFP
jgi:hypothetical protein